MSICPATGGPCVPLCDHGAGNEGMMVDLLAVSEASTSGVDLWARGIALAGVILAVGSLVWQFAQHRLTGPIIKAKLSAGLYGPSGAIVVPRELIESGGIESLRTGGYDRVAIIVEITNSGRLAGQICSIYFQAPNTMMLLDPPMVDDRRLPIQIEARSSATFVYPKDQVLLGFQVAIDGGMANSSPVTAHVRLGDQNTIDAAGEWTLKPSSTS